MLHQLFHGGFIFCPCRLNRSFFKANVFDFDKINNFWGYIIFLRKNAISLNDLCLPEILWYFIKSKNYHKKNVIR